MDVPAIGLRLRRAKYVVGKNLRRLGVEYSKAAAAQMWRERADDYAARGRADEAVNCRRKAVELAPAHRDLRIELGIDLARAAVRADTINDAEGWTRLGYQLLNGSGGGFLSTERAFRTALAQAPDSFDEWLGVSECLARRKLLDEARVARDAWFQGWIADPQSADLRRRQDRARRRGVPGIMFVAMMKSASEFIRENLIRALDVPEISVSVGTVPWDEVAPSAVRQLAAGGAIARSHLSANNLAALAANGVDRLILQVRDPRQVIVSWVHHMRRISDLEFRWAALRYDPPLPAEFRQWGLRRQMDWAVHNYMPGQLRWLEDWASALDQGPPIPVLVSTFEDFAQDQRAFFRKLSDFLGVAEIRVPGSDRQSAAAMRNFRSGNIGEWRDVLTARQIKTFAARIEPLAQYFGWERDALNLEMRMHDPVCRPFDIGAQKCGLEKASSGLAGWNRVFRQDRARA
jgi:tetratricopeptide (TPR) repeat protein